MRISKKQREEAIEVCLLRADEWIVLGRQPDGGVPHGLPWFAFADVAVALSYPSHPGADSDAWLEAAALLRGDDEHEPWSPGDPVYLLNGRR